MELVSIKGCEHNVWPCYIPEFQSVLGKLAHFPPGGVLDPRSIVNIQDYSRGNFLE